MELKKGEAFVLGLDYGSDSARAVLIDAADGSEAGVSVMNYPRWAKGMYCDPAKNQFRQHPLDYIEVLEGTVKAACAQAGADIVSKIKLGADDVLDACPLPRRRRRSHDHAQSTAGQRAEPGDARRADPRLRRRDGR